MKYPPMGMTSCMGMESELLLNQLLLSLMAASKAWREPVVGARSAAALLLVRAARINADNARAT